MFPVTYDVKIEIKYDNFTTPATYTSGDIKIEVDCLPLNIKLPTKTWKFTVARYWTKHVMLYDEYSWRDKTGCAVHNYITILNPLLNSLADKTVAANWVTPPDSLNNWVTINDKGKVMVDVN